MFDSGHSSSNQSSRPPVIEPLSQHSSVSPAPRVVPYTRHISLRRSLRSTVDGTLTLRVRCPMRSGPDESKIIPRPFYRSFDLRFCSTDNRPILFAHADPRYDSVISKPQCHQLFPISPLVCLNTSKLFPTRTSVQSSTTPYLLVSIVSYLYSSESLFSSLPRIIFVLYLN